MGSEVFVEVSVSIKTYKLKKRRVKTSMIFRQDRLRLTATMKTHLIRSNEMNRELFTKVVDLLKAIPGPLVFECDSDSMVDFDRDEIEDKEFPARKIFSHDPEVLGYPYFAAATSWNTIFGKCAAYRAMHRIPDDEYVLLLTDTRNDMNWFASLDGVMLRNGFVNTADWDLVVQCPAAFPITYEVVALLLQGRMFPDLLTAMASVHKYPIGCVNDFCERKREIVLKLRTADICRACMDRLRTKVPMSIVSHALEIMESLRVKMLYAQNFRQSTVPGCMSVDGRMRICFPGFGNIEVRLRPLEKALYRLFLNHPEGIRRIELPTFRQELYGIYSMLTNSDDRSVRLQRVDEMVSTLSNSAEEKISRIKRVFTEALGEDLARHYYISGERGEAYRIPVDRGLVEELNP